MVNWLKTKNGYVEQEIVKKVLSNNAVALKMYILIKTHKEGAPARPLISTVGSVMYGMAKYLAEILKPTVKSEYNIRSSMETREDIKKIRCDEDDVLISFGVISLF